MKFFICFLLFVLNINAEAARSPEERKALFQGATERLKASGIESRVPKVGDKFPELTLGEKKVSEWLKSGPLVVTFYRGGWCPYCVSQLKELDTALSQLKEKKANLVAISPETPGEVRKTQKKNDLDFVLLSDKDNALARKLDLVFKVEDDVEEEYRGFGINLEKSQGNRKNELPVPATFVVGTDGKIKYVFADADYTKRAKVEDILKAL